MRKRKLSGLLLVILLFIVNIASFAADDYPHKDSWGFAVNNCTSFAAWRLNNRNGVAFTNGYGGVTWGNAGDWASAARRVGITVNNTPAVGAIAWCAANEHGAYGFGHVAWVESISGNNVTVEEYNWGSASLSYNRRTTAASNFSGYIHIKDIATDTIAPTVQKVWFSDVTETSFKVHITASDNAGLAQIGCTVWSAYKGKDDQEWKANTCSGTSATTTLSYSISNHNNTTGTYLTSAVAYDTSWKNKVAEMSYGPYIGKYLDIGNGFKAVIKNTKVGKVLTCDSNGKVTSRTYTGSSNQWWTFTKQSDGKSYKIQNVATGLCLDVNNGSTEVAAEVLAYKSHDGNNQKWYVQGGENTYRLRAKSGWTVLDLYGLNANEGAGYDMYGSNDSDAQLFTISKLISATPTITASNVAGGKNITLACATSGATIYYTTNGSNPTTSSSKYTAPFKVTANTTVKAIAVAGGYTNSAVASSTVSVSKHSAPIITADDSGSGRTTVTISMASPGATVYYTTDGSNPTASSAQYKEPFAVDKDTTVKAYAVASGYVDSAVTTLSVKVAPLPVFTIYGAKLNGDIVEFEVKNNSNSTANGVLIIAAYDENGELITTKSRTVENIENNNSKMYEIAVPDAEYYQLLIWDSYDNMTPLCESVTV